MSAEQTNECAAELGDGGASAAEEGQLLGPLVGRGQRIVIGGLAGAGKTTFALRMLAAAVYGRTFLGHRGRGNLRALIIDVERGRSVKQALREAGVADLRVEDSDRVHYLRAPDGLLDVDAIGKLDHILDDGRYDIVMVDPLYARGAAVDLMRCFDAMQERFSFALILPMHCDRPPPGACPSVSDLFDSSFHQRTSEVIVGLERKNLGCSHLHWWKGREAPVGSYWTLSFMRDGGYDRMVPGAEAGKVALDDRVYAIVKEHGPVTREGIKEALWREHRTCSMSQMSRTLARLGSRGVTHDGTRLTRDRVYSLPMMFSADDAVANPDRA